MLSPVSFYPFLPHSLSCVTTVMTEINKNPSNDPWAAGVVDPIDLINITSQRVPFFQASSTVTMEVKTPCNYTAMISM